LSLAYMEGLIHHLSDPQERLHATRPTDERSMTPDDVAFEMGFEKSAQRLEIIGMDQKSLEYFIQHYGRTYRYLHFFHCPMIQDFSPLADLSALEHVVITWNRASDKLWDFSHNRALKTLALVDCRKMTFSPELLATSETLESVCFGGGLWDNFQMESLDVFGRMPSLRRLVLNFIRLQNRDMSFLQNASRLEEFHFDAGMLTTEEIAWICAKYPALYGKSLCAYNTEDAGVNDVRVCGFRKPGLDLPQHQKRLDRYVAQFEALVAQYRTIE